MFQKSNDNAMEKFEPLEKDDSAKECLNHSIGWFSGQESEFAALLLAEQCRIADARAGVILRPMQGGHCDLVVSHPRQEAGKSPPWWLARAVSLAHEVVERCHTVIQPLPKQDDDTDHPPHIILLPLLTGQNRVRSICVIYLQTVSSKDLMVRQARLEATLTQVELYETRVTLKSNRSTLKEAYRLLDTTLSTQKQSSFKAAAQTLCRHVAKQWGCHRVSLGIAHGGNQSARMRIAAISHIDQPDRRMHLVNSLEGVMEECQEQELAILHPAAEADGLIRHTHAKHARNHGGRFLLSIPLKGRDGQLLVLTLERPEGPEFQPHDVDLITKTLALAGPNLFLLAQRDRSVKSRFMLRLNGDAAAGSGYKPTLAMATWLAIVAILIGFSLSSSTYWAECAFVLNPSHQRHVAAPFDGFIGKVMVRPGDAVQQDTTVLGDLDATDLKLQRLGLKSELLSHQKRITQALGRKNPIEAEIARAEAEQVKADIELLTHRINGATLTAPLSGWIVSKDQAVRIGTTVGQGDILFTIASLDSLYALLHIPESMLSDFRKGQHGFLTAVGAPGQQVAFSIESIVPAADTIDGETIFYARTRLDQTLSWMRPGMSGVARVDAGQRNNFWMVGRRLYNWLRLTFWINDVSSHG
jgi:biotin carboxyl carrier protein